MKLAAGLSEGTRSPASDDEQCLFLFEEEEEAADEEGEPALLLFLLAVVSVEDWSVELSLAVDELGCEPPLDLRAPTAVSVCCSRRIAIDAPASLKENLDDYVCQSK